MEQYSADERQRVRGGSGEPRVEYAAILLGATGNVGGHILHLLVQSPLWKKVVVVTRRHVAELANPKMQQAQFAFHLASVFKRSRARAPAGIVVEAKGLPRQFPSRRGP